MWWTTLASNYATRLKFWMTGCATFMHCSLPSSVYGLHIEFVNSNWCTSHSYHCTVRNEKFSGNVFCPNCCSFTVFTKWAANFSVRWMNRAWEPAVMIVGCFTSFELYPISMRWNVQLNWLLQNTPPPPPAVWHAHRCFKHSICIDLPGLLPCFSTILCAVCVCTSLVSLIVLHFTCLPSYLCCAFQNFTVSTADQRKNILFYVIYSILFSYTLQQLCRLSKYVGPK